MPQQNYYNPFPQSQPQQQVDEAGRQRYERELMRRKERATLNKIGVAMGLAIIMYLVVQTAASFILISTELKEVYNSSPVFQYSFMIVFISTLSVGLQFFLFSRIFKNEYKVPVVPQKPIKVAKALAWICFGMGVCLAANIFVNQIILFFEKILKLKLTQGEMLKPNSLFACIIEVVGIAIVPAICEEFAMRCCSLQLLRNYGKGFAVCAVSVIFGLLHGNVIQFAFAFIVGVLLAYVTIKTDNIAPAVCIHALNNGLSAMNDIIAYYGGDKLSERVSAAVIVFWLIAAAVGTVILIVCGDFKREQRKDSLLTTGEKWVSFLVPGMIVPFIILIVLTATTIKPI